MPTKLAIRQFFSATSIALALTAVVCITAFAQVPPLIPLDEPAAEEEADDARDSAPPLLEDRQLPRTPWDLPPIPTIDKKKDGTDKKAPPASRDSGPRLPSDGDKYIPQFDKHPDLNRQPGPQPGDGAKLPIIPAGPEDGEVRTDGGAKGAVERWTPPAAPAIDNDRPRLIIDSDPPIDTDVAVPPVDRPDPSNLRRDDPPRGPVDLAVPPVESGVPSIGGAGDRPEIRVIGPVTDEPTTPEDATLPADSGDAPAIPSVTISPTTDDAPVIDDPPATTESGSPTIENLIAKYAGAETGSQETDAAIVRLSDESEALLTLLRDRRNTLADRAAEYRNLYRAGQVTLGAALEAHRELLDAELELAPSEQERVAIYENQLEYIKTVEGIAQQRGSEADQLDCKSLRLRIEIALHRAKSSDCTLAEVQVLRDCVESTGGILKDVVAKQNVGTWRGDTATVFQAGVEHCLAQADLAAAVNDTATAAEHLKAAAVFCKGLGEATKAGFDAGTTPLEDVLHAQVLHAQVQLKALKLEKE